MSKLLHGVTESVWKIEVRDKFGNLKHESVKHNLTTDTASGYTNRRDWQSKAMGLADAVASYVGTATSAPTTTTLTNSGASFPTSGQGLAGRMVFAAGGGGSTVFGVIVSNTSTVLTVDKWYNPGTYATGTTPSNGCAYIVSPGQFPACYIAVTENATSPAASDTSLAAELTVDGFARQLATFSHTAAASTYQLVVVFTATNTRQIQKTCVAASGVASTGAMPFESLVPSPPTLVSGDVLTETVTVTVN